MKRLFGLLLALSIAATAVAETLVVDTDGEAMVGAVVIDRGGKPVGMVDEQGRLPEIEPPLYPLMLRCIGFESTVVPEPTDRVVMTPAAQELAEIVVSPGDRPAMYVVCYIRETSTITDGQDSICVNSQYMADYMLPAFKGAKCTTWSKPRVLAEDVAIRTTTQKEPDKSIMEMMRWYDLLCNLSSDPVEVPESLRGQTQGVDSKRAKFGIESIYRVSPQSFMVTTDALAGRSDHKFSLGIMALFGMSMDITEMWQRQSYAFNEDGRYDMTNLLAQSTSFNISGRGKGWKMIFDSGNLPVEVHDYIEVYPVEISYLTKDDAKAMKKNKPQRAISVPEAGK